MQDFETILNQAYEASNAAVDFALKPYGGVEPELHMECGFGWVHVTDARTPFVRWCKAQIKAAGYKYDSVGNLWKLDGSRPSNHDDVCDIEKYGSPHWKKGWEFWNPTNFTGQWMNPKYEGSCAFVRVLRDNGIESSAGCRLD